MSHSDSERSDHCDQCGGLIPADSPAGICPQCAFGSILDEPQEIEGASKKQPLSPKELSKLLPQFTEITLLGVGGMGTVYKAKHRKLKRPVAIKILHDCGDTVDNPYERFAKEAEALAAIDHPNIVRVHDYGVVKNLHYIVMEFIDGVNLREVFRSIPEGRVQAEQALQVVSGVCAGLKAAHSKGLVHRDLKPENVMISRAGKLKIIDFGIARRLDRKTDRITKTGWVRGTQLYAAPEQFEDPDHVDHRADIYAVGVVLYEMLTGQLPVGNFELPSAIAGVSTQLDAVVAKALRKRKEQRYATAAELDTAVRQITTPIPIVLTCTFCNRIVEVDKSSEEDSTNCPHCGQLLNVSSGPEDLRTPKVKRSKKKPNRKVAPRILRSLLLTILAGAVLITIRHPDGMETFLEVPDGSKATVDPQGNITAQLPIADAPERDQEEPAISDDSTAIPNQEAKPVSPRIADSIQDEKVHVKFFTDEASWQASVRNVESFNTTSANIQLANEVENTPGKNAYLSSDLTFNHLHTNLKRSFRLSAVNVRPHLIGGIVFRDNENRMSGDRNLSIGDADGASGSSKHRDKYENDDFTLEFLDGPPVTALGFYLIGNEGNANEKLVVKSDDTVIAILDDIPTSGNGAGVRFVGITSEKWISKIEFDEDSSGDDIAIRDFRFAESLSALKNAETSSANQVSNDKRAIWKEADGGNGHAYEVVVGKNVISWDGAKAAAEKAGGYLVTITSKTENDFVFDLIDEPMYWTRSVNWRGPWIGGLQVPGSKEPAAGWTWVTGEPFSFQNWDASQPNNFGGINENRIYFGSQPRMVNAWCDARSGHSEVKANVVEYDAIASPADTKQSGLEETRSGLVPDEQHEASKNSLTENEFPEEESEQRPRNYRRFYDKSQSVEKAIRMGLDWVTRQQHPEQGYWSLKPPSGDVPDQSVAATSLALLVLQGKGYDGHGGGLRNRAVAGGHFALLSAYDQVEKDQSLYAKFFGPVRHDVYAKALMDLAICDLASKVDSYPPLTIKLLKEQELPTDLREVAKSRLFRVINTQSKDSKQDTLGYDNLGGWGYDNRSDASVTGWHIQVLHAAKKAHLDVPDYTIQNATNYLDSLWRVSGDLKRYIYTKGSLQKYSKSESYALGGHASASACLQLLGNRPEPASLEVLLRLRDFGNANAYYGFYGTLALLQSHHWSEWWNPLERSILNSQHQIRSDKQTFGSWNPGRSDGLVEKSGRFCLTCFRLLTLEVPQRYSH